VRHTPKVRPTHPVPMVAAFNGQYLNKRNMARFHSLSPEAPFIDSVTALDP